ncbi:MAG: ABC transporter substrate-binding protein [Rhodospirillaceae bacterium]|jgi:phospholipid transport system substrate-binding protein|nr:ABC transporter substrate-binding protein [Rhodospirillaceae bacterium]
MTNFAFSRIVFISLIALLMSSEPGNSKSDIEANEFMNTLSQHIVNIVTDDKLSKAERNEKYYKLFVSSLDILNISKFILSRYWDIATPEQQQEFINLLEKITVMIWANRFQMNYTNESLEILSISNEDDREWLVDSQITNKNNDKINLQWKLRESDDNSFLIFDVLINSISMIITQRLDYNAIMRANNGNIDKLIEIMRTKLSQLQASH